MNRNNTQPDTEWRKRYDAAHSKLENVTALALYQQLVEQCDPAGQPTAHVFAQPEIARHARQICLLAGSFNPLTTAHVAVAEAARKAAEVDVILWVLTAVTIDKERVARASLPDRLGQLGAFTENAPPTGGNMLALLNRGLYVDQATAVRQLLDSNTHLFILVGFDKIVQIFDPHYYSDRDAALQALFAQADILVAPRAGAGEADLEALLTRPENVPYRHHVRFIPIPPEYQDESSTEVRAIAARNDSASRKLLFRLVTPEGLALIETGAYVPVATTGNVTVPDVDSTNDTYLWRQMWIRAFARTRSPILWDNLPPLSNLVAYTVAPDTRGATIRRGLVRVITAPPQQVRRLLRALLAKIG
jgi:nicotinamide-nucleotide adenylyltransferase